MDEKMIVSVEFGGEFITTKVDPGSTVNALFSDGHLRGIKAESASVRVNGTPANTGTTLNPNDEVTIVAQGGKQAA